MTSHIERNQLSCKFIKSVREGSQEVLGTSHTHSLIYLYGSWSPGKVSHSLGSLLLVGMNNLSLAPRKFVGH